MQLCWELIEFSNWKLPIVILYLINQMKPIKRNVCTNVQFVPWYVKFVPITLYGWNFLKSKEVY
jgi:hypothetical protein